MKRTYQNLTITLHQQVGPCLGERQAELEQRQEQGNVVLAGQQLRYPLAELLENGKSERSLKNVQ